MLILSQKHDTINDTNARVAELVDAHDSKSCGEIHESSSLSLGTSIKIEAGKNQNPTLDTLKKISKALGVSVDDLIN